MLNKEKRKTMKTRYLLITCLLTLPGLVRAQGTVNALESDFATRASIAVDKKLARGLHLSAEYQLRTESGLSRINRHQASLGLNYKFNDYFKGGLEYTFIYHNGSSAWSPRHRAGVFLQGGFNAGDWRFTLRENFQWTHRTGDFNTYQNTPDLFTLKSRFKVQYKGFKSVTPYAYVELKNVFNDPSLKATWNSATSSYSDYSFLGYGDTYFSRYRGSLGLEWKINKHNSLEFYGLVDYLYNKDIDTNKSGTKLKSLTWDQTLRTTIGVGYTFKF